MAMAVFPGKKTQIGRYELKEKLGEGGMGVVWRAFDSKTGGDVAIKIMKDISDPAALELFTKEWRALAEMCHPNIVDVRDVDVLVEDNEQKPFFVMPLLRGSTLSELIRSSSERLTVGRTVEIMSQVCRGLQAAHQRGLIHRDLKPSNIFVMDDDTAKVIDFGVVYLAGTHSITGQKGTFQYMSPEQVQMKEVTPASDIFALGTILYESLTGRKPFASPSADETMQAVLKRIPPSVSELNPTIPHAVSQVVHKCLAKQPIHRFSSARELAEMLQKASRNEPVFDPSKLQLRVERAKTAFKSGDEGFASELLSELESEGHLDPEITVLRMQIDMAMKQKKIRQLMESARARIEQDEIPLGLDKLREVLELDPEHADALALKRNTEKRRSEAQASKWVELATTHLDNCDFTAARHAAQEALASRAGDPRALDLLSRIDNMEVEAKRVREQKEQLYSTAMKAYQNGEIDSALSRMVRLFSVVRSRPEGAVPDRDAVYESFYQQVRSEHDSIRMVLEQAQHEFSEENFEAALALCAEHLAKYPHDGVFQALKIQVEDAERQKVSAYIAEVTRNADAEPDLDRRANLLREASERYPNEGQFAQQLKVVRERRDLVNSIVAKARQFGERRQYSEELSQWDMLRNIHPRYPGLNYELEQCRKKRDQEAQDEEKARLVEEIVRLMDSREFNRSLERTRLALMEFPGDAELAGLERLSLDGLERAKDASKLLALGQAEAAACNWTESSGYLREAKKLDPLNTGIREALIYTLTEHARTLLGSDWAQAQRLQQEAGALDGNHRAVRTLGMEIAEARRQTDVGECLTDARALKAAGDLDGAYERIRKGREEYRNDARLEQFEAWLLKENEQLRVKQERATRLAELGDARDRLERNPDSDKARHVLRLSRKLGEESPDDPETMKGIADAEQTVRRTLGEDDLTSLLNSDTNMSARRSASADADEKTRLFEPEKKGPAKKPLTASPRAPMDGRTRNTLIAGVSALAVLALGIGLLIWQLNSHSSTTVKQQHSQPVASIKVHVDVSPVDSVVKANGVVAPGGDVSVLAGRAVIAEVSRIGYKPATVELDGKTPNPKVTLEALPVRIALSTGEKSGIVELDGTKAQDLVDGTAEGLEVPADGQSHTLTVTSGRKNVLTLTFRTTAGQRPQIDPLSSKDLLVVSSLGSNATVYGGDELKNTQLDGTPVAVSNQGTDVPTLSDGLHELSYLEGSDPASVSLGKTEWPSLSVHVLGAGASMLITTNADNATLTANGKPVRKGRRGWLITEPGNYAFVLTADNYAPQNWNSVLKPHQMMNEIHTMDAVPGTTLASLVIAGGTPGTEVEVDGKPLGEVNEGGSAQFAGKLSAGNHVVVFRKAGFCDTRAEVAAGSAEVHLSQGKMESCGSVMFKSTEAQATAKVRRAGESGAKWIELPIGRRVQLPVGEYEAEADFPGSNPVVLPDMKIAAGSDAEFAPHPTAKQVVAACGLQNQGDVTQTGGWLKPNSNSIILLMPGCVNMSIWFQKPSGGFFGVHKKVEWVLYAGGGTGRIEYELDGAKLTRKAIGQKTERAEAKSSLNGDADTFRLKIQVEGERVRILSESGETVDDYTASDPTLSNLRGGKLGVKTNAYFKLSGGA